MDWAFGFAVVAIYFAGRLAVGAWRLARARADRQTPKAAPAAGRGEPRQRGR